VRYALLLAMAFHAAALAQQEPPAATEPAAQPDCRAIQEPMARLACYDARAAAAPPGAKPYEHFGLPQPSDERAMKARLVGKVDGWERGTRFSLDNGQVWRAIEPSRAYYAIPENVEVVISRGTFGGYWMEFAGVPASVKVKRTK
jgi:hypothetical protein